MLRSSNSTTLLSGEYEKRMVSRDAGATAELPRASGFVILDTVVTPDLTAEGNAIIGWLTTNGVTLAIVAIVALLVYRWARPRLHRVLVDLVQAPEGRVDRWN